jgi:hypothetical protein
MRQAAGATAALCVLMALTAGARAQVEECSTMCGRYDSGQCVEYLHTCTTTPEAPKATYGAIAYGRTKGTWGTSYHWETREKAERVALENCAKQGAKDCEIMVWFDRKCGALASGEGPDGFWGLADTIGPARADAKSKCVSSGNKGCEVLAAQCSR